jgi:sec-independent protein translocase protein TatC
VKKNPADMQFFDHLEELRWRVIKSAIAIALFAIPCGIYWKEILDIVMIYPLREIEPKPKLIFTAPAEIVMLSFQIAISGGLIAAAPVVFFQLWRFVSPGLYKNERRMILPVVVFSTLFFLLGILFCYFTFPLLMKFLVTYAGNRIDPMFKINDYFGFLLKLSLSFGIVFELPVVSFVLARVGVLTAGFLIKHFRYAVIIIFIVAAILTPPDVVSQCILAAPLLLLYGLSILVAAVVTRGNKKREATTA